jgi:signal transduction histidine kinase
MLVLLFYSFRSYRKGQFPALVFFTAILILLLGSVEYVININGLYTGFLFFNTAIPSNMQVFIVIEVLVVFFALFYRYKLYHDDRLQLQNAILIKDAIWKDLELKNLMKERRRMAMDIHDGVGSKLFGIRILLENHLMESQPSNDDLRKVKVELQDISVELSNVIWNLSKGLQSLDQIVQVIEERLNETLRLSSKQIRFSSSIEFEIRNDEFLNDLQFIVMEIATNYIKYSSSSGISISFTSNSECLVFTWHEDQPEEYGKSMPTGMGLSSIHYRIQKWSGIRRYDAYCFDYTIEFPTNKLS